MAAYTKKPVTIEAMHYDGGLESAKRVLDWMNLPEANWMEGNRIVIPTMEGDLTASGGDWIIRGVKGEFYPCKPDIFAETYAPAGADVRGLPVSGYRPQNEVNLALVNVNKATEEQVLRILDGLAGRPEIDKRWLAIGRTAIENGFMAVNRAVFQPGRIALPGDVPALAAEDAATAVGQQDTRSRGEPRVPRHDAPATA